MSNFPETTFPQQYQQQQQTTWWGRNWKIVVPVGCGGCLVVVLVVIALIAWGAFAVFGMLKESEPYKYAVAKAKASPAVRKALGEPIEEMGIVAGNLHFSGTSGNADLTIPLVGPKGAAIVYVVARQREGEWTYSTLDVEVAETHERIDLLEEEAQQPGIEEGGEKGDEPKGDT